MNDALQKLLALIKANDGINDKARLARIVFEAFGLTKDRSVYYCADFAIRFSSSAGPNFGNTVLSLSNLRKYAAQQTRLQELMTRWRQARDAGQAFAAEEQTELDALAAAELRAATARARALLEGFAS